MLLVKCSNPLLEPSKIIGAQSIGFRYHRYQVHSRAQSLHDFDIQWLECMAGGSDKVEAGMDSEIYLVHSAWLLLLQHVGFVLVVKKFDNW